MLKFGASNFIKTVNARPVYLQRDIVIVKFVITKCEINIQGDIVLFIEQDTPKIKYTMLELNLFRKIK